jgi:hypothetical protein
LFAVLTQEFDETTVDNVEEGKRSIALVFNDRNCVNAGQQRYYGGSRAVGEAWHGCFYYLVETWS